ncbi:MAG TPA: RusA family crossover junction endodeoxyribonuclease, partial [Thermomicrobiaceae bacterium]|nr:RusA family crossover junction endodeoxyribonuclease [Thermomicrobiaceae bacterium]
MIESLDVVVHGHPRPQGSMISLGRGRPVVASNREVLHPWRDAITAEVMKRTGGKLLWSRGVALRADLVFVLPQPASSRYPEPSGRVGDLDKLVRAALDAVTASRAWQDDSQVLELTARKCYPAA